MESQFRARRSLWVGQGRQWDQLVSFLSAFPEEKEFLYPPLTYLKPEGKPQTLVVDDAAYTVVTVTPIMS